MMNPDSSVGIALEGQGLISGRYRHLYTFHSVQTASGGHIGSYQMGMEALSPGVKRSGSEADNSPPSSAEVKNGRAIPPLPHTSS
jgi:hypothetical protein